MQKEDFEYFKDLNVRIEVGDSKFYLYGTILRVSNDSIVFKTDQKTSILLFKDIKSVVSW